MASAATSFFATPLNPLRSSLHMTGTSIGLWWLMYEHGGANDTTVLGSLHIDVDSRQGQRRLARKREPGGPLPGDASG